MTKRVLGSRAKALCSQVGSRRLSSYSQLAGRVRAPLGLRFPLCQMGLLILVSCARLQVVERVLGAREDLSALGKGNVLSREGDVRRSRGPCPGPLQTAVREDVDVASHSCSVGQVWSPPDPMSPSTAVLTPLTPCKHPSHQAHKVPSKSASKSPSILISISESK